MLWGHQLKFEASPPFRPQQPILLSDAAAAANPNPLKFEANRLRIRGNSASAKPNRGNCTDLAEAQALAPMPDSYSEKNLMPKYWGIIIWSRNGNSRANDASMRNARPLARAAGIEATRLAVSVLPTGSEAPWSSADADQLAEIHTKIGHS